MRDNDPLASLDDFAARISRSPSQVRWMRHQRTGPRSALIGGRIMYRWSDIEAWIDEQFAKDDETKAAAAETESTDVATKPEPARRKTTTATRTRHGRAGGRPHSDDAA